MSFLIILKIPLPIMVSVSEVPSSFEDLVLRILNRILERDLAALLFGAMAMIAIIYKYWNIPKKWENLHDRVYRIEARQKKYYPLFLEEITKSTIKDVHDFEQDKEDED